MRKFKDLTHILLIDDDEATNFLTELTINNTALLVEIEKVYNAQDGLDFLRCIGKYTHLSDCNQPQIIFLDINMPGLNGWDFLVAYEQMRSAFVHESIIIILTTSLHPDDQLKAKQFHNVKGFLNKPLTEENVVSIVNQYFEEEKA